MCAYRKSGGNKPASTQVTVITIDDHLAAKLENKGLWRRAAARWQVVMNSTMDDHIRYAAFQRQSYCIKKVSRKHSERQSRMFSLCISEDFFLSC